VSISMSEWGTIGQAAEETTITANIVGLLDGAMHVQAVLYRTTRIKTLCMEGSHWN
jgi:hypothetical protein